MIEYLTGWRPSRCNTRTFDDDFSNVYVGCLTNGWSIVSSAPTNSQFAGALAGFVFLGVTILFGRPGARNANTLAMFSATFVVLGFDSYLFSLVTGGSSDKICLRVWSEALAASGMLAVGAVALIVGIAWLMSNHTNEASINSQDSGQPQSLEHPGLGRLARPMVYGVTFGAALLLSATSLDYLRIAVGHAPVAWIKVAVLCCPALVGAVVMIDTRIQTRKARVAPPAKSSEATSTLWPAGVGLLIYGVAGPLFAGVLTQLPDAWWSNDLGKIVAITLVVGLVAPSGLLVLVVSASPHIVMIRVPTDISRPAESFSRRWG